MEDVATSQQATIRIERSFLTVKRFIEKYPDRTDESVPGDLKTVCQELKKYAQHQFTQPCKVFKSFWLGVLPILTWLPRYNVKQWLVADLISGITIGIMQIPQGMSYALLAGQHPIYGLYTAFYPVILYTILGTSRHVSMGAFAITSLMLGTAVSSAIPEPVILNGTIDGFASEAEGMKSFHDQRIILGASTAFVVGVFLVGLSLINLGFVVVYLSDPMISGFTCGAAVHVFVSQLKSLFGVKIGSYSGPLNIIWVLRDLVVSLTSLDEIGKTRTAATVVISIICVAFLLLLKELNERYKHKLPLGIPIPGEIFVVVLGTAISYAVDLQSLYYVNIVGDIPSGLPPPSAKAVRAIPSVVGYAIPIAIVGYSVAVSIAKIFGNNFGYQIRPNQELVAYGWSNLIVSFFYCIPAFPSMSRSCVQVDSGGKTQLVGWISAFLIFLVLFWIGPLFKTIPKACLASIIAVAIKGMLRKARDFKPYWKTSKLDGAVWVVSCIATIFLDVVYGLAVGVGFSMLSIVFRTQFVQIEMLSQVDDTELYRKSKPVSDQDQRDCQSHENFVVIAFNGPLHYVNKDRLRTSLIKACNVDPALEKARKNEVQKQELKMKEVSITAAASGKRTPRNELTGNDNPSMIQESEPSTFAASETPEAPVSVKVKLVVLDCTSMSFMDSVGVKHLIKNFEAFQDSGIKIVLANVGEDVMQILAFGGFIEKYTNESIFLSIHDAITWWRLQPASREPFSMSTTTQL